ncbi:MAG: ABC transporter permease [candidate division Zixibacteria bacterium]|nr:ABC transporter permease [candidate division Zixibacteria bacterium]MDD5425547.1 ABC transporter permease [candidate division Zixibacteria bacterium]
MLRNYLKFALRNIKRNKGYSSINIAGLAIGMACCILITMWVLEELSFDRYHENAERIYRVGHELTIGGISRTAPLVSLPMAPAMVSEYPEVVNAVRFSKSGRTSVRYGDKVFYEEGILFADNSVFDIFSFPLVEGDPGKALTAPLTAVLCETIARKYFGDENPIGKTLLCNDNRNFTITGVVKDVPRNSHFTFDILCSYETLVKEEAWRSEWGNIVDYAYILLEKNNDYRALEAKLPALIDKNFGEQLQQIGVSIKLFLQPLTSIHLNSHMMGELAGNGNIDYVYLFSGIAVFILLIACVNFINLATARALGRAKEVGMRKTFGAVRSKLIRQFIGESILFSLLAVILALLLLELFLPLFGSITGRELSVSFWQLPWFIPGLLVLVLLVGLAAGSYPAFYLSSFRPIKVLKGDLKSGRTNARFRSVLVIFQFTFSITLIAGTIIVYNQLNYVRSVDLGFQQEQVVVIPNMNRFRLSQQESLKNELSGLAGVVDVALSSGVPGRGGSMQSFLPEGFSEDQSQLIAVMKIDERYLPAMGIELVSGRNFSKAIATDSVESVIINETAAAKFGWDEAIGKIIKQTNPESEEGGYLSNTVIGVVKDFHLSSLHEPVEPLIIVNKYEPFLETIRFLSIRLEPGNIRNTMDLIANRWSNFNSNLPFDYFFLDESFAKQYRHDEQLGNLVLSFSLLAVLIGCLGLLGLSSFTAEQRTREIAVRKVLGASIVGIVRLMLREFIFLVLLANVFAWPLAYLIMKRWLESFAYHVDIGMGVFVLTALISMVIAVITVGYQAVKTAILNPVEALRHE